MYFDPNVVAGKKKQEKMKEWEKKKEKFACVQFRVFARVSLNIRTTIFVEA